MKVYLVNEEIDLGYHVSECFLTKDSATSRMNELESIYRKDKIAGLIKGCNYSLEKATEWVNKHRPEYFIEEIEVKKLK